MTELTNWTRTMETDSDGLESIKQAIGIQPTWYHNDVFELKARLMDDMLVLTVEQPQPEEDGDSEWMPVEVYDDVDDVEEAEQRLAEIDELELLTDRYLFACQKLETALEA